MAFKIKQPKAASFLNKDAEYLSEKGVKPVRVLLSSKKATKLPCLCDISVSS